MPFHPRLCSALVLAAAFCGMSCAPTFTVLEGDRQARGDWARKALRDGGDVNVKDRDGRTPLHMACVNGDVLLMEALLARGADPHLKDNEGISALKYATLQPDVSPVKLLLARNVNVDERDRFQNTPLMSAAMLGHDAIAELLISRGADVNARNVKGTTPLHFAATFPWCYELMRDVLVAHGANVNAKNDRGETAERQYQESLRDHRRSGWSASALAIAERRKRDRK
jgi:ankyrin repeat protein